MSSNDLPERPLPEALPAGLRRRQWLATVMLGVCATLAIVALATGPFPREQGQRVLLALVACGPILLMRRWPLPVLAVVGAGSALFAADAGSGSLPLDIMAGLATYVAASRLPRRTSILAAVAIGTAQCAALGYAALTHVTTLQAGTAVVGLLPLAAAWLMGDSIAARRRYLAGLAEQAERERAAEAERATRDVREERVRIARELHDVVAHTLAVITVQAGVGRRLMDRRPEEAVMALESIEMIGRTAQDELRVVLGLLRDEEPAASAALAPAPRLADLKELADTVRASGTPVELRLSGTDRQLSPALELSIYRVVQEALTNVVKHAPLASATADVHVYDNHVSLQITDDGSPRDEEGQPVSAGAGHGIVGMRERVAAFGGWLTAEPLGNRGFRVAAEIPAGGTG